MNETNPPRPVSDALRHVRRELGTPAPGYFEMIRDSWSELVGPALADHSFPSHLRSGVLRVVVDDPAWAGQFRYLADGLVQALGERVPGAGVREVSAVARRTPDGPDPAADDDT